MLVISYIGSDADFVNDLAHRLQTADIPFWADAERPKGKFTWNESTLRGAAAVVVVISPEAVASQEVLLEWAVAYGAGIPLVPILYRKAPVHHLLRKMQGYDFTSSRPWEKLLAYLARFITITTAQPTANDDPLLTALENGDPQPLKRWL